MKKLSLLVLFILFAGSVFAAPKKEKPVTKYVAVESAPLKSKASVTGKKICNLEYGEVVIVYEENGAWSRIQKRDNPEVEGWFSTSALTKNKLIAKGENATTDAKEIALAGKGFSSAVEEVFSEEFKVDYSAVNEIEKISITEEKLLTFIKEGELNGGEE